MKKCIVVLILASVALGAHAGDRIQVQVPAILERGAAIPDAVRRECAVDQLVGTNVFERVNERPDGAGQLSKPDPASADPFLKLTILDVQGAAGGGLTSAKNITIRADLLVNGQPTATKTFMRGSRGGFFGGMTGTCSIMERIAETLGKDVANWLPATVPTKPLGPSLRPIDTVTAAVPSMNSSRSQTNQHRKQIPPATTFSSIDDVAAVPVNEAGRVLYREYLTMQTPKAFVVYSDGNAKASANDDDAMTKLLDNCTNEIKACWLYAVDDKIVWSQNEGARVGLSVRLRNK